MPWWFWVLLWGALITMTAPAGRRQNPGSASIP